MQSAPGEDDGISAPSDPHPEPSSSPPPVESFEDAPLPRSSAATLAAMLDTDDPFNTKKKPMMSLDDLPIGGNKAAQAMSAYPDDPSGMGEEEAFGTRPPPPRRPPVKAKAKVAADEEGDPTESMDASTASPAPRRPPVKAKAKVVKEEKEDKSSTAKKAGAAAAGAAAGAAASGTAVVVKYDTFKGEALMDADEAEAELKAAGISEPLFTALTSKKWSEAVEGLTALTAEVEAIGGDDFTPHLPALLSVLSRTPSFKAANFNVCRAVYDCYASALSLYLLSSSTSFSPALAYHPLSDVLNKLSDAKLVESIHHLLSVQAECVGPRFMWNHTAQLISKESFKNVKAQEAALHWLVTLVEQFGLGSLDVLGLIEQSHQWLQSTAKGVKDDSLQLLLSVYKQSGALFKEKMLMGLKPSTAKDLEALFASVPADRVGQSTATKWKKGDSEPAPLNLDLLVPRVDLSHLITEKLLKRMQDDNWKERKEAMDEVELLIKQNNNRIQNKDGGVLEVIGKWRLVDKNKNLSRDALALLALFCVAMGKPMSSYRDKVVPNLFVCLADSKKLVKDEAMKTVEVWMDVCGIASVGKYLPKALQTAGSRQELLNLINKAMGDTKKMKKEKKDMELDELIPSIISCLQDKLSEVRVTAEKTCTLLCSFIPFDALQDYTKNLKKAEVLKIQPILDRVKKSAMEGTAGTGPDKASSSHSAPAATEDDDDGRSGAVGKKAASASKAAATSSANAKAKTASASASSTLKKGAVEAARTAEREKAAEANNSGGAGEAASTEVVRRIDSTAKAARVRRDAKRVKGSFREWGSDEVEEMNEKLRELVSESFHGLLFHKDFAKQMTAIEGLDELRSTNLDALISILDLVLRWCSWRMCDANTAMLLKLLAFITALFHSLLECDYTLQEGEANDLLPFLIEKVLGHNTVKFRQDSKELLRLAARLYDEKAVFALATAGMESKNKRVQSECIELLCELMLQYGLAVGDTKKLVPNIALLVGASDAAVRAAALNCMGGLYERYGEAVYTLMGGKKGGENSKVPPKQMAMIEERLKRIKPGTSASTALSEDPDTSMSSSAGGGAGSRASTGAAAGRTPQKKSPPGSITASPRVPLGRTLPTNGIQLGRTPVRGASIPPSKASEDEDPIEESTGAYDNGPHSQYDSHLSAPSSSSHVGRKSFTASINADLPSCFSLDLDGGGGAAAISNPPSTLSGMQEMNPSTAHYSGGTYRVSGSSQLFQTQQLPPHSLLSNSAVPSNAHYSTMRPSPSYPPSSQYGHIPSSPLPSSSSSVPPSSPYYPSSDPSGMVDLRPPPPWFPNCLLS